jgi:hypothetical protein
MDLILEWYYKVVAKTLRLFDETNRFFFVAYFPSSRGCLGHPFGAAAYRPWLPRLRLA